MQQWLDFLSAADSVLNLAVALANVTMPLIAKRRHGRASHDG